MSRVARPPRAGTALAAGASALQGVGAGVLGSFFQSAVVWIEPVPVPWGVVAGLVLTGLVVVQGVRAAGALGGAAAGVGWFVAVGLLSSRRPEGDVIVTASLLGYVWLVAGALTAVAVIGAQALRGVRSSGTGHLTHGSALDHRLAPGTGE